MQAVDFLKIAPKIGFKLFWEEKKIFILCIIV